jgi:hypothetical protein
MRTAFSLAALLLLSLVGSESELSLGNDPDKSEPAARETSWRALFKEDDLTDWEGLIRHWTLKKGELVGTNLPGGLPYRTFLCSKKKYKDFEIKFQVRVKGPRGRGNSGFNFRSEILDRTKFNVSGAQADIGEQYWGALTSEFVPRMPAVPQIRAPKEVLAKVKSEDFNDYYIKCVGQHVTIKLNGETTADADVPWMQKEGIIAWQIHVNPTEVTFRDIQLHDLSNARDSLRDSVIYGDISELKVKKAEDKQHVKTTPPPEGAIVLFDGRRMDGWVHRDGKTKPVWKLLDKYNMEVRREGSFRLNDGDLMTEEKFGGAFRLHVEFRVPYMPRARGEARGNSGIYIQGRYEVQILDSYGLKSGRTDCGAIFGQVAPAVNACKAPTIWQSFDIEFVAPKCEDGKQLEPARMTVYHNGVKIHDNVKLANPTQLALRGDPCMPGPILLQDHGNPVQFRNIWLLPLQAR